MSRPSSLPYRNHKVRSISTKKTTQSPVPFLSQSRNPPIIIGDYQIKKQDLLGKGFCSKVFRAVNSLTGEQYALKLIDLQRIKSAAQKRFLKNEVRLLHKLKGAKHVIQLKQIVRTTTYLAIVTELCKKSVSQLMKTSNGSKRPLQIEQALRIFEEVVIGYLSMRSEGLVHRDIKTANILIGQDGEARLCDLGFAAVKTSLQEDRFINVGSPLYMAPQIIKGNNYSQKGDVWALGLVLLEMLIGEFPWADIDFCKLRSVLMQTRFQDLIPKCLEARWKVMLLQCLQLNPQKRCSSLQIIKYFRPDYQCNQNSIISRQNQSSLRHQENRHSNKISIQTTNTEIFEQAKYSHPTSRIHPTTTQQETHIPRGFLFKQNNSQDISQRIKSYSSKTLKARTMKMDTRIMAMDLNNKKADRMIQLKLGGGQQSVGEQIKRQQLSKLQICRLMFRVVEMIDKTKDNLHCTYFNFNSQVISAIISQMEELFNQIRACKSQKVIKDILLFKKSRDFNHLIQVVDNYHKNFCSYFKLKKHTSNNINPQSIIDIIQGCLTQASSHFHLILSQIQHSKLALIDDQELCQFIYTVSYLATLLNLLTLKSSNHKQFTKCSKVEHLLKAGRESLTLMQIRQASKILAVSIK